MEKTNSNDCSSRSIDQNSFSHEKIEFSEFSGICSHAVLIFFDFCHSAKKNSYVRQIQNSRIFAAKHPFVNKNACMSRSSFSCHFRLQSSIDFSKWVHFSKNAIFHNMLKNPIFQSLLWIWNCRHIFGGKIQHKVKNIILWINYVLINA